LLTIVSEYATESVFPIALELIPFPDSLKHTFLGPDESLLLIIAFDRDRDQEDKLTTLLRENKEALG